MTKYEKQVLERRLARIVENAVENKKQSPGNDGGIIRRLLLEGKKLKLKPAASILECAKARAVRNKYGDESIPKTMLFEIPAAEQKKADVYAAESERLARVKPVLLSEKEKIMDRILLDNAGSEVVSEFEKWCKKTVKAFA